MKKIVKEYLTFSNREKRGVLALLILLVAFSIAPYFVSYFYKEKPIDFSVFEKEIKEMTAASERASEVRETSKKKTPLRRKDALFMFNPNNLPAAQWAQLGCSEKQIKTLLNYQKCGGSFRNKGDLKKIYGFSP